MAKSNPQSEFYVSGSDEEKGTYRAKVDRLLAAVRHERLGGLIKFTGFDEDGDACFTVEAQAVVQMERLAQGAKLRLFRMRERQRE